MAMGLLAGLSVLFLTSYPLYQIVLRQWSFVMAPHPFIDMEYITAQIRCWQDGVDVYRTNPCDPLGRLHDYSPLWLRMRFLPQGYGWAKLMGLMQDVAFALSLGVLPAVHGRRAAWLLAAAIASPITVFAMERGNVDVGVAALTLWVVVLMEGRPAARGAAYGTVLAAGLLKFYPLVLFAQALTERPRVSATVTLLATIAIAWVGIVYADELRLAISNVPIPSDFGDGFSSHQLGDGIAFLAGHPRGGLGIVLLCDALSVAGAIRLAAQRDFAAATAALSHRAWACLVAAALLFCGCFFAGPSVGYRGVVLLLALPGCMLMARNEASASTGLVLRWTPVMIVAAMWNIVPLAWLGPHAALGARLGALPFLAVWVLRELVWWSVATVMLAVIWRYVAASRVCVAWPGGGLPSGQTWLKPTPRPQVEG